MPSAKATYQLASTAFLKRDYVHSIEHASALLALLPPPSASQSWAVELSPKARLVERWRAQASALIISASAIDWKAKRNLGDVVELADDELFLQSLMDRTSASYRGQRTPIDPILPPSIIQNFTLAAISLSMPNGFVRALCESYLSSIPAEAMEALASAAALGEGGRSWWMEEALEGYEDLMERYLVEVLVDGADGREAEREEARKLVEWNECLRNTRKTVRTSFL